MKKLTYSLESDFYVDRVDVLTYKDANSAIRRDILRAIASHTCEKILPHQTLIRLSILLILCDALQSWETYFDDLLNNNAGLLCLARQFVRPA